MDVISPSFLYKLNQYARSMAILDEDNWPSRRYTVDEKIKPFQIDVLINPPRFADFEHRISERTLFHMVWYTLLSRVNHKEWNEETTC